MSLNLNTDWRNKRNQNFGGFSPNFGHLHHSIARYCTETRYETMDKKSDLNEIFSSETYLNQLNMLSNPLQKNLADTLPKTDLNKPKINAMASPKYKLEMNLDYRSESEDKEKVSHNTPQYTFGGIGNFISGIFNVISAAMPFQRRSKSPTRDYIYNSEDFDFHACVHDGSPPLDFWLPAKTEQQNKNNCSDQLSVHACDYTHVECNAEDMSIDCHAAVAQCEEKLNKVRSILTSKTVAPKSSPNRLRRPRRVFIEPNSIEESFEDAFSEQDLVRLPNTDSVECVSLCNNINSDICEVDSALLRTKMAPLEPSDIEKPIVVGPNEVDLLKEADETDKDTKSLLIQSCEDKVSKLKALLCERRKNNTKSSLNSSDSINESEEEKTNDKVTKNKPIPIARIHNKKFKNPNRLSVNKRSKCHVRKNIEEDMKFANEIDLDSSVENSPRINSMHLVSCSNESLTSNSTPTKNCFFDEITGRFRHSSTTESEDSFQIVFADSPQLSPKPRRMSDCDSEDSFIIFEESPDSCYTSTDVFGELPSDIEETDENSTDYDSDLDSGHNTCRLAHSFSRTVSDLTDDSLYDDNAVFPKSRPYSDSEDEVDSAVKICDVISSDDLVRTEPVVVDTGLLLNDAKKLARKNQIPKKVHFSEAPPQVRVMRVWAFAAKQARVGHWEQFVIDRDRFKRRIADVDMAISWVLKPQHRARVKFQRFMPWWHAQRRQEAAEKKLKDEEDRKKEDERKIAEEEREQEELAKMAAGDVNSDVDNDKNGNLKSKDVTENKVSNAPERKEVKNSIKKTKRINVAKLDGLVAKVTDRLQSKNNKNCVSPPKKPIERTIAAKYNPVPPVKNNTEINKNEVTSASITETDVSNKTSSELGIIVTDSKNICNTATEG